MFRGDGKLQGDSNGMNLESYMANDLREAFARDMPAQCRIGQQLFSVLLDDLVFEEIDTYGGPEKIEMQRVHFLTTDKANIDDGSMLQIKPTGEQNWITKIVISSTRSADGNELIVTVRGN
jgi:hypothetical protein